MQKKREKKQPTHTENRTLVLQLNGQRLNHTTKPVCEEKEVQRLVVRFPRSCSTFNGMFLFELFSHCFLFSVRNANKFRVFSLVKKNNYTHLQHIFKWCVFSFCFSSVQVCVNIFLKRECFEFVRFLYRKRDELREELKKNILCIVLYECWNRT